MNKYTSKKRETALIIGLGLVLVVVVWFFAKNFWPNLFKKNKKSSMISKEIAEVPFITNEKLYNMLRSESKIAVVDIRPKEDFRKGHIEKSLNIPLDNFYADALSREKVNKMDDIIFYDSEGKIKDLALVTKNAQLKGFVNAKYLRGGLNSWKKAGYPLVSGDVTTNSNKIKTMTPEQFAVTLELEFIDPQIIDIRNPVEFENEHIIDAENIPLAELEKNISKISNIKTVLIYGESKEDQEYAASILFDLNFLNIYMLEGGLEAWKNSGGRVEKKQ